MQRALPKLPAKAAYILINNPARRNALSLATLQDLRDQLARSLTSPLTGRPLLLPPFRPSVLSALERAAGHPPATGEKKQDDSYSNDKDDDLTWLVDPAAWYRLRPSLPAVLVLRSSHPAGSVFSSGHDLRELSTLGTAEVRRTFALCAEVMSLMRRSPAPVVCAVEGLATRRDAARHERRT
uniref:Uncharacterized protein n=1 Tax=Magnaporthiopsis poae (strain ATCC 64411 / 73-15) TaxID=644358 RepID=A0A0C4EF71_MAGP6